MASCSNDNGNFTLQYWFEFLHFTPGERDPFWLLECGNIGFPDPMNVKREGDERLRSRLFRPLGKISKCNLRRQKGGNIESECAFDECSSEMKWQKIQSHLSGNCSKVNYETYFDCVKISSQGIDSL